MAKATPLRASFGNGTNGVFHSEKFNIFCDEDLKQYAQLRNRVNDTTNGIKIETMREYTRKTSVKEGSGEDQSLTTSEEVILVVHYWAKKPERILSDNNKDLVEAKREWSAEITSE